MMKYCPKCGSLLNGGEKTCPQCHTKFIKKEVETLELPITKAEIKTKPKTKSTIKNKTKKSSKKNIKKKKRKSNEPLIFKIFIATILTILAIILFLNILKYTL